MEYWKKLVSGDENKILLFHMVWPDQRSHDSDINQLWDALKKLNPIDKQGMWDTLNHSSKREYIHPLNIGDQIEDNLLGTPNFSL